MQETYEVLDCLYYDSGVTGTNNTDWFNRNNLSVSVLNDGTSLTWDLMKFEGEEIKFEFEMYNTKNIIILTGASILIVIIIIFIIIKKSKKNKKKQNNNIETTQNTMPTQDINQNQNNNIEPNTQTVEQNSNQNLNQQQNIDIDGFYN